MPRINVKLNDDDRAGGLSDIHPDGPMRVKIVDCTQKTKNDGTGTYLSWRLDPSGDTVTNKRPVWLNTSLQTGKLKGLKALLDAAQVPYEIASDGGLDFDTDNAIGAELVVTIGQQEYQGEKQNNVKFPYSKV